MNGLTNILTTGLLAATMIGIGTAGTAIAASEETKVAEQHNYVLVHEINTTDVYKINGDICTYEDWIAYLDWIQGLQDGDNEGEVIVPDDPVDPEPDELAEEDPTVTFADSEGYDEAIMTAGSTFTWLAIYNAGTAIETINGCNSFLMGMDSEGYPIIMSPNIRDDYRALSCICRQPDLDYNDYVVDCTSRAAPGVYNDQGAWSSRTDGYTALGAYVLHNARVEIVNRTSKIYKGAHSLYQIVISYDWAYTYEEYQRLMSYAY